MTGWSAGQELWGDSSTKIVDLIRTQLATGLTYCKVAEQRKATDDRLRLIALAEKTLETANEWMWRIEIHHEIFDTLTAELDLLKLRIEALKAENRN
jgi:hypothetical protein